MSEVIVLDTHIWYWWINLEHHRLPNGLIQSIENAPRVGVSAVSCFEMALAHQRGRMELPLPLAAWFDRALQGSDIEVLPLTPDIALRAVQLAEVHRDPFDRIIIATALTLDAKLASVDSQFPAYPELAGCLLGGAG